MPGYTDQKEAVQTRLRRIEGQVRGVSRMVDEDAYCIDVLTQISAATKALQAVALELLDEHLDHCVAEAIAERRPRRRRQGRRGLGGDRAARAVVIVAERCRVLRRDVGDSLPRGRSSCSGRRSGR